MFDEVLFEQRLKNFNPEPLITPIDPQNESLEIAMVTEDEKNIDLAKANYLNLIHNEEIKQISEQIIKKFGVGTCGPRAFYGTTEIHLELEERLARFLHMEESIIYSYGFVTISSAVAACCKETDVVFIDEYTNVPIWQGLKAARSRIIKFSHNNPWDFHQKALSVTNCRKFLILEGISWTTGQLCPLPSFLEIAERFKIRVFVEESYTLGVFGNSGRGLTEYYRIEPSRIDMIMGTFERAMGSIGGFCAGSFTIISQQQVAGSGYIFSASLPTYLVGVVLKGLELMGEKPVKFARLAVQFHRFLEECGFDVTSHPKAPFKLVKLETKSKAMKVHQFCRNKGVHFIRNHNELVINLNVALMDDGEKLRRVFETMKEAADLVN